MFVETAPRFYRGITQSKRCVDELHGEHSDMLGHIMTAT